MIRVLVVEDDPMVAKFHEHYMSQLKGFELADTARNGDEALQLLAIKKYDLVLLDIFMPGIDGLSLLSKIRASDYDVDVIVISAARDKETIQHVLRNGAIDYIIKPFEFERFSLALMNYKSRREALENRDMLRQEDLDKTILYKEQTCELAIPKGLDRNTLRSVWEKIVPITGAFTTEELAELVGISRVSIRKYLDFLKSLHVLSLELHRGAVGRPVYKFKCVDPDINLVNQYFQ